MNSKLTTWQQHRETILEFSNKLQDISKIILNTTIPVNLMKIIWHWKILLTYYYTTFDVHPKLHHVRAYCALDQLLTQYAVFDGWSTVCTGTQVSTWQKNYWHWIKWASPTKQIIALLLYNGCQCNWNIWKKGCHTYTINQSTDIKHIVFISLNPHKYVPVLTSSDWILLSSMSKMIFKSSLAEKDLSVKHKKKLH